MASFVHLPVEIIDQIFIYVLPADLENFAQVCRKVYSVAQSHLETHRTLIRRFATVANSDSDYGRPFREVLIDIITNPLHAHYIVDLHYRRYSAIFPFHLFLDCPFGEQVDFKKLIILLPNLKTLTVDDVDVSDSLLQFQNAPYTDPPTLTKLASIYLCFPIGPRPSQSLRITRALSNLPSLKLLSTQNCGAYQLEPGFFAPISSPLTRLELWDCFLRPKELREFLKGFHQLKTFKHSTPPVYPPPFTGPSYDPFLIRSGLLNSKTTLQHLTLLAPGRSAPFVGYLAGFENLEEMYMPWEILEPCWVRHDPSYLSLVLPKPLRRLMIQNEGGQGSSDHPPDGSRLAPCVVSGRGCGWRYRQLVESVILSKSTQTRSLSELILLVGYHRWCSENTSSPLSHDLPPLQRRCNEVGITLNIH